MTGPGAWPPELRILAEVATKLDAYPTAPARHQLDQLRRHIEDRLAALNVELHPEALRVGLAFGWVLAATAMEYPDDGAYAVLTWVAAALVDHLPLEAMP